MKAALALCFVLPLLSSCGGSGNPSPPAPSVTLSANGTVVAASTTDQYAADVRGVSVGLYVANPPASALPLTVQITPQAGLASYGGSQVVWDGAAALPVGIAVQLKPPSQLGPGVYESSYLIEVCLDKDCATKLPTSPDPLIFTVTYDLR